MIWRSCGVMKPTSGFVQRAATRRMSQRCFMACGRVGRLLGSNCRRDDIKSLASLDIWSHTGSSNVYRHRVICSIMVLRSKVGSERNRKVCVRQRRNEQWGNVLSAKGCLSRKENVGDDADGPEIGLCRTNALECLGSGSVVPFLSTMRSDVCQLLDASRQTKVDQLDIGLFRIVGVINVFQIDCV